MRALLTDAIDQTSIAISVAVMFFDKTANEMRLITKERGIVRIKNIDQVQAEYYIRELAKNNHVDLSNYKARIDMSHYKSYPVQNHETPDTP